MIILLLLCAAFLIGYGIGYPLILFMVSFALTAWTLERHRNEKFWKRAWRLE